MHRFMRAAGFSDFTTEESVYNLLRQHVERPENLSARLELEDHSAVLEYRMPVNEYIGVCAAVLDLGSGRTELQYYYPYYNTGEISSNGIVALERHTQVETYAGVIDEYNIGLSLIFYMTNPVSYRRRPDAGINYEFRGTALSAFANAATILLPVAPAEEMAGSGGGYTPDEGLIEAARNGDIDAIETLTASDIEMYQEISERIETEDLYSVVEQSFMPCGIECDQYSIIGEILETEETENSFTGEKLILMKISSNNVEFRLCMRRDDLLGEPMKGRRIKCKIWMQGSVNVGV